MRSFGFCQIFFEKSEHDPVDPLSVPEIRLPFDSLPHETGAFGVPNGAFVNWHPNVSCQSFSNVAPNSSR